MNAEYDEYEAKYEAEMAAALAGLDSRWNVTGYRAHQTHNGVAFAATLRWGRIAVATIEDSGTGGGAWPFWTAPHALIHPHADDNATTTAREEFAAEAARLFPDGGGMAQESLIEAILRKAGK